MSGYAPHSYLGGSNMHRWTACPGSFELCKAAPKSSGSSMAAARGTCAHALGEALLNGLPMNDALFEQHLLDALTALENTTETHNGLAVWIDKELLFSVETWVRWAVDQIRVASWHKIEAQVELDGWFGHNEPPPVPLTGRADLITYKASERILGVGDLKSGHSQITLIDNPQLLYYAAGALRMAPGPVDWVKLSIVQPDPNRQDQSNSWTLPAVDLLIWIDDVLKPAVAAVTAPGAALTTGDHCTYCPAIAFCPAWIEFAHKQALRDFAPLDDITFARELDWAEEALVWIKALQAEGLSRINAGRTLPGWGLVPTRAIRKWITGAETTVADKLLKAGADVFDVYNLRSPAQIEKTCKVSHLGKIWSGLVPHVTKTSGTKLGRVFNNGDVIDGREDDGADEIAF
jgi:hypothetical protein